MVDKCQRCGNFWCVCLGDLASPEGAPFVAKQSRGRSEAYGRVLSLSSHILGSPVTSLTALPSMPKDKAYFAPQGGCSGHHKGLIIPTKTDGHLALYDWANEIRLEEGKTASEAIH